jgi:hypothetical protein
MAVVYLSGYTKVEPFLYKHVSESVLLESLILAEYQLGHIVNASVAGMCISTENTFFVVPILSKLRHPILISTTST